MLKANEVVNVLGLGRCTVVFCDGHVVDVRTTSGDVYPVLIGECRRIAGAALAKLTNE